jgi:hypothetical protein
VGVGVGLRACSGGGAWGLAAASAIAACNGLRSGGVTVGVGVSLPACSGGEPWGLAAASAIAACNGPRSGGVTGGPGGRTGGLGVVAATDSEEDAGSTMVARSVTSLYW